MADDKIMSRMGCPRSITFLMLSPKIKIEKSALVNFRSNFQKSREKSDWLKKTIRKPIYFWFLLAFIVECQPNMPP
jgi:hypothetical protein